MRTFIPVLLAAVLGPGAVDGAGGQHAAAAANGSSDPKILVTVITSAPR